jgi:NADPH-dependent glutamate synthase beta subunit-like oxidoreductase
MLLRRSTAPIRSIVAWSWIDRRVRCHGLQQRWSSSSHRGADDAKSMIRVAIVGSGPSGCYTAKYLQNAWDKLQRRDASEHSALPPPSELQIDVLDRLPTPYGLVRFGVAPDHPEVKNVQNDFDALFEKGVRFFGHVNVGSDVSVEELREMYDAVVLSYGCQSDRRMGIPGEELDGVLSAREFVAWYNGEFQKYIHTTAHCLTRLESDQTISTVRYSRHLTSCRILVFRPSRL